MTVSETERKKQRLQGCNVHSIICLVFTLLLIVALFFIIWPLNAHTHTNMTRPTRDDHSNHRPTDNVWWKFMNFSKNDLNISGDCYMCSLIPHTHDQFPMWEPTSAEANQTICALLSWEYASTSAPSPYSWCNDSYFLNASNWRDPHTYSNITNQTNAKGIHVGRKPQMAKLAFSLECQNTHARFLGRSAATDTIPIPNWRTTDKSLDHKWHAKTTSGYLTGILKLNVTNFLKDNNYTDKPGPNMTTTNIFMPWAGSPAPYRYVWVCGKRVFLYLPSEWCGSCHLAKLVPTVKVVDFQQKSTQGLTKRSLTPPTQSKAFGQTRTPLIGDTRGVFMTLFAPYGVAYLSHKMNEVWWTLEDITDALLQLTDQLRDNPELRAMRAMLTAHQLALDYLFAAEGGLCTKFGVDHCCTYIPDSTANWTKIHDRVADLSHFLINSHDPDWSNFDLPGWFTSGTWLQILFKILTPILMVLFLFCLFTSCIIPCLRTQINKLVSGSVVTALHSEQIQLLILDQDDDLPDDNPGRG